MKNPSPQIRILKGCVNQLADCSVYRDVLVIRLLNNKFSGGFASLSFDQGVPKKLLTSAPSNRSERHLTVFCIDQIVPGFVVYYLNVLFSD